MYHWRHSGQSETFEALLNRYFLERLLYRLGRSPHRERFILKGALLFALWSDAPHRATRDIDLLGHGATDPEAIAAAFRDICASDGNDGVEFRASTVRAMVVREDAVYAGVRVTLEARLGQARQTLQVDVGFGDAVVPAPGEIAYPTLLNQPTPTLRAYPREVVVAEKFQALVALGMANSRMKDFFDLWALARDFTFDGATLSVALAATFARRRTASPEEPPLALTPAFAAAKEAQWRAFARRTALALPPLIMVLVALAGFLMPPSRAVARSVAFTQWWLPGGPWTV
ncbi:MAG TPA: nucleotidyl transferase AbiEii/AbiGii toxin family protein [Thermomicrobiales bacterium]|nr:nucleotidyl transferase AbiEii/AbiGii toxin family protein [Thermomicrobiales bacterium]